MARWTEIDAFAIRTSSILTAARIATKLRKRNGQRTRQRGIIDGVVWMCLTLFREGKR